MMGDLCICCGERPAEFFTQTSRHCHECQRLVGIAPDMSNAWPLLFARSMARMVRRAEVEGLVADVRHETLRHDYHCNNRRTGCGCRGDRAQSALDRLAALAMEVEP